MRTEITFRRVINFGGTNSKKIMETVSFNTSNNVHGVEYFVGFNVRALEKEKKIQLFVFELSRLDNNKITRN